MKKFLSYSLLAAAAAAGVSLADTATTTPVGYVSLTVPANGDTNVGQPLQRPSVAASSASAVSGSTVSVASNQFTASQFVYNGVAQPNSYYLLVTSGPLAGRYFDVVSNTVNSITVDANLATLGLTTNATFAVHPYWTLNTLFAGGAGVGVSTDELEPVAYVSFVDPNAAGANKAPVAVYFYYQGSALSGNGWYDNNNTASGKKDDLTIDPFQVAIVRNLENTQKTVTVSGVVPTKATSTQVQSKSVTNDNYVNLQIPIDVTLGGAGLIASGAFNTSTDELEPVDYLSVYNEEASQFNKAPFKTYFHYTGSALAGTGWYDNNNTAAGKQDAVLLKAGRQILIRKAPSAVTTVNASTPLPYTP